MWSILSQLYNCRHLSSCGNFKLTPKIPIIQLPKPAVHGLSTTDTSTDVSRNNSYRVRTPTTSFYKILETKLDVDNQVVDCHEYIQW